MSPYWMLIVIVLLSLMLVRMSRVRRMEPSSVDGAYRSARAAWVKLEKVEHERRELADELAKTKRRIYRYEEALKVIKKAAVRDEAERKWVLHDDRLALHDKGGYVNRILNA